MKPKKPGQYWDIMMSPITVTGCHVSRGCDRCWHHAMARRFYDIHERGKLVGIDDGIEVRWHEDRLMTVRGDLTRRVVAVGWLGDMFHPLVPREYINRILDAVLANGLHIYLFLTKHPGRMAQVVNEHLAQSERYVDEARRENLNLWFGTSVEDQPTAEARINALSHVWHGRRWVSYEPAKGPMLLPRSGVRSTLRNGPPLKTTVELVVAGGETGAGASQVNIEWFMNLRDQCRETGVTFYLKTLGDARKKELKGFSDAAERARMIAGKTYDDLPWVGEVFEG